MIQLFKYEDHAGKHRKPMREGAEGVSPRDENIDSFWDIGDMLPARPAKKTASSRASAPEAVQVRVNAEGAEPEFKIPPRREREIRKEPAVREFCPPSGFIKRVRIIPWPTDFSFYAKFRNDALRYFDREHEACDYIYFFSYMPQYDQMTAAQAAYYLYWRGEVRREHYIKADNSYLFLYIYEIINLPDKIPPETGAVLLSRLWRAYREDFRYLDKYIGEWLCDYCLIYGVEPDWQALAAFSDEIAGKVSLPEFYLRGGELTYPLIRFLSSYDYRKSKYYAEHHDAFDRHIPAAAVQVLSRLVAPSPEKFGVHPAKISRDGFSGAVACRAVKCKLELTCFPLRRSYEMKQLVTGVIKLCENQLRAALSIKARFSPAGIDERIVRAVSEYFDAFYPERFAHKRRQAPEETEEAYMALYEPENKGPADIKRALAIEQDAWETAALLGGEADEDEMPCEDTSDLSETPFFAGFDEGEEGDFAALAPALDGATRRALVSAFRGEFAAFCRAAGLMPETVKSRINELAMELAGDIVLDDDFTVIEDYGDELFAALTEYEEDTD